MSLLFVFGKNSCWLDLKVKTKKRENIAKKIKMSIFRPFYPIFRRNSTFILFVVTGGFVFDKVFNSYTRYFFFDVINKGVSFK